VTRETWAQLQAAADQHGVTVARFSRLLLEIIARDSLYTAVIDPPPRSLRATATKPDPIWREALAQEGVAA